MYWNCLSLLDTMLAHVRKLRNAISNLFVRFVGVNWMCLQMAIRSVISNAVQDATVMC